MQIQGTNSMNSAIELKDISNSADADLILQKHLVATNQEWSRILALPYFGCVVLNPRIVGRCICHKSMPQGSLDISVNNLNSSAKLSEAVAGSSPVLITC